MKKTFSALLIIVMVATCLCACSKAPEEPKTTVSKPAVTETTTQKPSIDKANPFTGDENFKESAVGKRPVAVVIENHPQARPQWGIGTADIVVEGEVEGGISRMLWLYADYTSMPEEIGPTRSARPSFVQFANFFDAYFVHWGGSHNRKKKGYIGGYGMITELGMAHFDGMKGGALFGRNKSRRVATEHTGVFRPAELPAAIKSKKYRKKIDESKFTKFSFNEKVTDAGETNALKVGVKFSKRTDTRNFEFDEKDGLYHTNDWKEDVAFQNIIVLCPKSTYITLPYKSSSTTYLNYEWSNGKGYYISNGKACEISWDTSEGVIKLTNADGKELCINKGQSYIGFSSSNNEGKVNIA